MNTQVETKEEARWKHFSAMKKRGKNAGVLLFVVNVLAKTIKRRIDATTALCQNINMFLNPRETVC